MTMVSGDVAGLIVRVLGESHFSTPDHSIMDSSVFRQNITQRSSAAKNAFVALTTSRFTLALRHCRPMNVIYFRHAVELIQRLPILDVKRH